MDGDEGGGHDGVDGFLCVDYGEEGAFDEVSFGDNAGGVIVVGDDEAADFVVFVFLTGGVDGFIRFDGDEVCGHDFFDEHRYQVCFWVVFFGSGSWRM